MLIDSTRIIALDMGRRLKTCTNILSIGYEDARDRIVPRKENQLTGDF